MTGAAYHYIVDLRGAIQKVKACLKQGVRHYANVEVEADQGFFQLFANRI